MDGFPGIKSKLLDHLLEPAGVLISLVAAPWDIREPLVHPLAGGRVRHVSNLGRDLRDLPRYRGWAKHASEAAIELGVHPDVECQAGEHGGR
jgi:hypothetical protein